MIPTHLITETVGSVMTERPVVVLQETPVAELYGILEERGITACPVVNDEGELVGMASRVDLLRAFRPSRELHVLAAEEVLKLPVREIMHCGVVTLEPEDPLVTAVDLFADTRFHVLPVVRRGSGQPIVVGILAQSDALRHLMRTAALTQ
jgi:CBS domain-containing protein